MLKHFELRFLAAGLVVGLCCGGSQSVHAQGSSIFNGSGSGLSRTGTGGISGAMGGTGFGSSATTGRSSAGGGGMGGMGGAAGGLGAMMGGANPFGQGGTGFGGTGAGGLGGATGASGFTGRTNTGFAGNAQAGQGGGNMGGGGNRNFNLNGNSNSQRNNNFGNNAANEKRTSAIRPRQRVAFEFNAKTPATVVAKMSGHFTKIGVKNPELKDVQVRADGGHIVLTGKVKTSDQAKLAENLLRLEPGVRSIKNELQVEQVIVIE